MGSDYMPVPFDSRKIYHRSPFGAVEEGTKIHFRILLPKAEHTQKAHLCVKYDYDCNWEFTELIWCGKFDEDTEIWECDFTPKKIGLYWYNFKLTAIDKTRYVIPSDPYKVSAIEDYMGRSWQITCYKKGFKTPGWLVGGIMYQIFPDRFYFSGEEKNITRTDFKRNKDWYALPEWKPDENGMIKNNDFFMGDLKGITMKLDYLESLGVSCIYLNPISEAYSNHRYDTGDYSKVDPILGTEEDFKHLCAEAKKRGIHIINDGVFSHTGSDSVYFNRYGRYGKGGAYNDKNSPYFSWYKFNEWPNNYQSWWGFDTLPEVIEETPSFNEYINGKDGIALDTGHFDQARYGIAGQAQRVFHAQGKGLEDRIVIAAGHFGHGRCRHSRSRPTFGLAAADGTGDRGIAGNDGADTCCREQSIDQYGTGRLHFFGSGHHDGRHDAAGTGCRAGDDFEHLGIGFTDSQGIDSRLMRQGAQ